MFGVCWLSRRLSNKSSDASSRSGSGSGGNKATRHEASWPLNFSFPAVYYKCIFVYKWNENEMPVKMRKPALLPNDLMLISSCFLHLYVMLEHAISKASSAGNCFAFPLSYPSSPLPTLFSMYTSSNVLWLSIAKVSLVALFCCCLGLSL